jgi:hypothetical protein
MFVRFAILDATLQHHFQGAVMGALLNMYVGGRLGLGKVSLLKFYFIFYKLMGGGHFLIRC